MTEVDLSAYAALVEAEYAADQSRRFHEAEAKKYERVRDQARDQLRQVLPVGSVGMINGKPVMRRTQSKQFAPAKFQAAYPDIWDTYKVPHLEYELDMDKLRRELPDLVAQFSTERWTNTSEVLE